MTAHPNVGTDLIGRRFGRLVVTSYAGSLPRKSGRGTRSLWSCLCDCGACPTVRRDNLTNGSCRSCGCLKRDARVQQNGENHPCYKGGRITNGNGYVEIRDPSHPNAFKTGYVLEHVAVMSKEIGRPLHKGETVHHRNGKRDDNRAENLELWAGSHPKGQRPADMVRWAKTILELYDPESLAKRVDT